MTSIDATPVTIGTNFAGAAGAVDPLEVAGVGLAVCAVRTGEKASAHTRTAADTNTQRFMGLPPGKHQSAAGFQREAHAVELRLEAVRWKQLIIDSYISPFQSSGSGLVERKISRCHLPPPQGSITSAATTSTRISANVRCSGSPSR